MAADEKIAHLQMIQGVITRMASNSFALKTLCATLATAIVAYYGAVDTPSRLVVVGGIVAILVLWLLDAMYLRLERQFRDLYDAARKDKVELYSMNFAAAYENGAGPPGLLSVALSWSVIWIYLIFAGLLSALAFGDMLTC
jgi:hypothetical protein